MFDKALAYLSYKLHNIEDYQAKVASSRQKATTKEFSLPETVKHLFECEKYAEARKN